MKRAKSEEGVRKWYGDDWILLQNELYRALEEGVLSSVNNVILGGVEVTGAGPTYDVSAGIVYLDGRLCTVNEQIATTLPIYLKQSLTETKTRSYIDTQTKGIEETYGVDVYNSPQGGAEIIVEVPGGGVKQRILLPHYNAIGALSGIPKSDSAAWNTSDVLATAAAVNLVRLIAESKEPGFTKNTAFNQNFGMGVADVARGSKIILQTSVIIDGIFTLSFGTTNGTGGPFTITTTGSTSPPNFRLTHNRGDVNYVPIISARSVNTTLTDRVRAQIMDIQPGYIDFKAGEDTGTGGHYGFYAGIMVVDVLILEQINF